MANYNDMRNAALKSQQQFNSMQERVYSCFAKIVRGLITYSQVPQDAITLLKWNGSTSDERDYCPAEPGKMFTLPGATIFDDSDGYWHLGLCIGLTQLQFVSFVLCITEQDGAAKVKTGVSGKAQTLNFEDESSVRAYCESICEQAVRVYSEPTSSASRTFGFLSE
ncbi:MAG: hypothetical protein P4M01_10145 [Acidobacteriota bacterium]|nr:hypothetical protein [Acidobacteriota bacterium]